MSEIKSIKQAMSDYRSDSSVSQSFLKLMSASPKNALEFLNNPKSESKSYFDMGILVETLMLYPEQFDDFFFVTKATIPQDKMRDFAEEYVSLYNWNQSFRPEEQWSDEQLIMQARENVGYNKNLKAETVISKFMEEAHPYCKDKGVSVGKILVTADDVLKAERIVELTKSRPYFKNIFYPESHIEVMVQVPIMFLHESDTTADTSVSCKALVDVLVVDHEKKTIEIIDVKTFSDNFLSNYYKFKYYYQAAFYYDAVRYMIDADPKYKGYTISRVGFLAVDVNENRNPEYFVVQQSDINIAKFGGHLKNYYIRGFVELLYEYNLRLSTGNWEDSFSMMIIGYTLIK